MMCWSRRARALPRPALVFRARLARAQQQRGDAFIDEACARSSPHGGWYELQFLVRTEACVCARRRMWRWTSWPTSSRESRAWATMARRWRPSCVPATSPPPPGAEACSAAGPAGVMLRAHVEAETCRASNVGFNPRARWRPLGNSKKPPKWRAWAPRGCERLLPTTWPSAGVKASWSAIPRTS